MEPIVFLQVLDKHQHYQFHRHRCNKTVVHIKLSRERKKIELSHRCKRSESKKNEEAWGCCNKKRNIKKDRRMVYRKKIIWKNMHIDHQSTDVWWETELTMGYLSTPNSKKSESESVSVALLALPVTWDIFQLQIVNNNWERTLVRRKKKMKGFILPDRDREDIRQWSSQLPSNHPQKWQVEERNAR